MPVARRGRVARRWPWPRCPPVIAGTPARFSQTVAPSTIPPLITYVAAGSIDARVVPDGPGEGLRRIGDGHDLATLDRPGLDLDQGGDLDRAGSRRRCPRGSAERAGERGRWCRPATGGRMSARPLVGPPVMTGSPMAFWYVVVAGDEGREEGVGVGRVDGGRVDDDREVDRQGRRLDPLLADDGACGGVGGLVDDRDDRGHRSRDRGRIADGQRARDGRVGRGDRDRDEPAKQGGRRTTMSPSLGGIERAASTEGTLHHRTHRRAVARAGRPPSLAGRAATVTASAAGTAGPTRRDWRARRDSNPRPSGPQPDALSTELRAHAMLAKDWRRGRDSNPRSRLPHLAV